MKKHTFIFLLLSFCMSMYLSAQDVASVRKLTSFINNINIFSRDYPQEKVYLHFDNTAYRLGETIWFKAYVVTAELNALSDMSKTLYVELITGEGNVLETRKLKLEGGQCHGDFLLRDSLFTGFYEVRAFTRYMLNQDKEYLFSRVFPVYNKPKKAGDYSTPSMRERFRSKRVPQYRKEYEQKGILALTFYPEGGNLISGIPSKVAFKATGKNGENATVSGSIVNEKGIQVAELSSSLQGMGVFEFTPDSGKYTAKVQYNDKDYTFDIPIALPKGYAMSIDNRDEDKLNILIQKTPDTAQQPLGLSISCRGKNNAFEQVTFDKENELLLTYPKKKLPSGVTQITLFNTEGEVLSERLVFVNHHDAMKIDVTKDKPGYLPFEKVNLNFQLSEPESTFSVSVSDAASTINNPYTDNLFTNLLLSSELKGYIENPGYYFETDSPARKEALDLLMLTQGWSRYVWKQRAGVTPYIEKHPVEESLVIGGSVLSLLKKSTKPDVEVTYVMMSDSTSQHGSCMTDNEGKFHFALKDFYGASKLTLQTKEEGVRKESNIQLDRAFSPETKIYSYREKSAPEAVTNRNDTVAIREDSLNTFQPEEKPELQASGAIDKKTHKLKEVEVKAPSKLRREGEALREANIVYNVEKSVDEMLDKGVNEPATILDFIRLKNPYFTYERQQLYGKTYIKGLYKGKSLVIVLNNNSMVDTIDTDKKILNNYEKLEGLMSNEIETITVCETEGTSILYWPNCTGHEVVIFIYTYKNFHRRTTPTGIRTTRLDGYVYSKEFYNPNYEFIQPNKMDYRRTLYWNPDVKTDKDGKASISFYNNSSCKKMNINAETVTENGVIGVLCK